MAQAILKMFQQVKIHPNMRRRGIPTFVKWKNDGWRPTMTSILSLELQPYQSLRISLTPLLEIMMASEAIQVM